MAVSGGADSVSLAKLIALWAERGQISLKDEIFVAIIDHGLQEQSDEVANNTQATCQSMGLTAEILCWEGQKPKTGLQEAARHARYHLLANFARQMGAHYVMTAHHRDDLIETCLMRMRRGGDPSSFAGMEELLPYPIWPEGQGLFLLRPCLDLVATELHETAGLAPGEFHRDRANESFKFERVRLRKLLAYYPSLSQPLHSLSQKSIWLRQLRRRKTSKLYAENQPSWQDNRLIFTIDADDSSEKTAFIFLLQSALPSLGGASILPSKAKLEQLWNRLRDGQQNAATLSGARVAVTKTGQVETYN